MAKAGRKEEIELPVTTEKKLAWRQRMKRLGLNQSALAKKLNVTRAGVSHLFKAARQSSLVPHVDRVLGLGEPPPPGVDPETWTRLDEEQRGTAIARSPGFYESRSRESFHGVLGDIRDPHRVDAHDAVGREMVSIMSKLIDRNRDKLLDIARKLYDEQDEEIRKNGLLYLLEKSEREAIRELRGAEEMREIATEKLARYDAQLAELESAVPANLDAVMRMQKARDEIAMQESRWSDEVEAARRELKRLEIMRDQAQLASELGGRKPDLPEQKVTRRRKPRA